MSTSNNNATPVITAPSGAKVTSPPVGGLAPAAQPVQSPPLTTAAIKAAVSGGVTSMAATTTAAKPGSNLAAMQQAWLDKCKELGERKGSGTAAELEWFEDMVERANRKEIDPSDAQLGYNKWREGVDARQGFKAKKQSDGTKSKAVSEARTMIQWGTLPNASAPRIFGAVQTVVNATPTLRGEMAEHLLKVVRAQIKKPDSPFTKEEIKHLLTLETEKPAKVEVEELAVERKRLHKIGEKFTFSNHLRAAIGSLSERIEQLGGTAAERAQAAKAAKKAAAKAKKKK